MKRLWPVFAVAGLASAFMPMPAKPWTLMIEGDADGYLSPCGCTFPMTGGVRRRASFIRTHRDAQTVVLDAGGLGGAPGRQGEMKAETAAQVAASIGADAVHITERDARLGPGSVRSVGNLAGDRLVSTNLRANAFEGVRPYVVKGPFLIGGVSAAPAAIADALRVPTLSPDEAAQAVVTAAKGQRKRAVVMFSGDLISARKLASEHPGIDLLIYRSGGAPSDRMEKVGSTHLVTLGEKGKVVLQLKFDGKAFSAYSVARLGPEVPDDPSVSRLYRTYLRRVDAANLLARLPRRSGAEFAGTETCGSCHEKAMAVWSRSGHSHALKTLEKEGHGRDPDCVSCHVTGLEFSTGFQSRVVTPTLAEVGCESCHGAGAAHAADPEGVHLPKIGEQACASCHQVEQSPNFRFETYWPKIAH